jgi:hypothetical protein
MLVPEGFQCEECGRFFVSPDELRTHDSIVHVDRPPSQFPCYMCGRQFDSLDRLAAHGSAEHPTYWT